MPEGPREADPEPRPSGAAAPPGPQRRRPRLAFWRRAEAPKGLNGVLTDGRGDALSPGERQMIERIIAFDKKRVDDVAIPRADIVGVEEGAPLPDLLKAFSEAGHSRLPVYRGDLDDPVGMVHIKDLVGLLAAPERGEPIAAEGASAASILSGIIRRVLYVPPSMPVTDLLLRMQAQRVHMALVIDEFGGTDGLVTIEDLIEEIVGDIRDEHDDEDEPTLRRTKTGRWDADARIELEDFAEKTGIDLALEDQEADTIGGMVAALAGRVPVRGEVIEHPAGLEVEVAEADPRRIRRVLIRAKRSRKARPAGAEDAPQAEDAAVIDGGERRSVETA
jgi:CBS domain containing-hemolysin-like protein